MKTPITKLKGHRIISEGFTIAHPEEVIVVVFKLKGHKGHEEVWRETADDERKIEWLERDARVFVRNL
jgi:hypothetical protein